MKIAFLEETGIEPGMKPNHLVRIYDPRFALNGPAEVSMDIQLDTTPSHIRLNEFYNHLDYSSAT